MKGEGKEEVLHSIKDLITMFELLKLKVDSIPEDSDLLPYIAFTLTMGKTAANTLHKKFMVNQMTRVESNVKQKKEATTNENDNIFDNFMLK